MPTGLGLAGAFPPLAGSEWVTGRVEVPIALVLHGMQGEVTVKGAKYNGVMTPWGAMFSDQEIANVVTYIRSQWGNKASAATAADVAKVRAATKARTTPFTAAEVKKLYP
jgi:mono/diheme cytochrome c family protein